MPQAQKKGEESSNSNMKEAAESSNEPVDLTRNNVQESEGHSSTSSSLNILPATPPEELLQVRLSNNNTVIRKIKKPVRRKTAPAKIKLPVQIAEPEPIPAAAEVMEPVPVENDIVLPLIKAVRSKKPKKVPYSTLPPGLQPYTAVREQSQDIADGPVPKVKKMTAKQRSKKKSSIPTPPPPPAEIASTEPDIATTVKVVRKRAVSKKSVPLKEAVKIAAPVPEESTTGGLPQAAPAVPILGGLLIEQLQMEGKRKTRSQYKLEDQAPPTVNLPGPSTATTSSNRRTYKAANQLVKPKQSVGANINKTVKSAQPSSVPEDAVRDEENNTSVAETAVAEVPTAEDIVDPVENDQESDTDHEGLENVISPRSLAVQVPAVPSDFNFSEIALNGSGNREFSELFVDSQLPSVSSKTTMESWMGRSSKLVVPSNSDKQREEVRSQEYLNEQPGFSGTQRSQTTSQPVMTKGILKRAPETQRQGVDLEVEGHSKKRFCFASGEDLAQIHEVERFNNGRTIAGFSPRPISRKKPSSSQARKQDLARRSQNFVFNSSLLAGNSPYYRRSPSKSPSTSPSKSPTKQSNGRFVDSCTSPFVSLNTGFVVDRTISQEATRNRLHKSFQGNKRKLGFLDEEESSSFGENSDVGVQPHRREEESETNWSNVEDPANTFVNSQTYNDNNFRTLAYPNLIGCSESVSHVLSKLTTTSTLHILKRSLGQMKITTIGQLCGITVAELQTLAITSPRLETFRSVMQNFEGSVVVSPPTIRSPISITHFLTSTPPSPVNIGIGHKSSAVPFLGYGPSLSSGSGSQQPSQKHSEKRSIIKMDRLVHTLRPTVSNEVDNNSILNKNIDPSATIDSTGTSSLLSTTGSPSQQAAVSDMVNNFRFLSELREYMQTDSLGARRLLDFLLTDKICTINLFKSIFSKEDLKKNIFFHDGLQMPKDMIASAIGALVDNKGSQKLVPFIANFLDVFQQKLIEKSQEGVGNLDDWCKAFLISFKSEKPIKRMRTSKEILGQVVQDLEEFVGRGPLDSSDSIRVLDVVSQISCNLLTPLQKKDLIHKTLDSMETQ